MRHSTRGRSHFRVRLACVKHAASVQSEPESNSPVQICTKISAWQKSESQSSLSTRSSLVNEPEKEFFTPAVFCGIHKTCSFVTALSTTFLKIFKKLFVKAFRSPAVSCGEGGFYAHPSCMSTVFSLFPGNLLSGTFREGLFSGGERDVYASRTGVSIFSKNFFQEHGFPFCFSSAAWDLPVRLLPAAALFSLFLSNAEAHRSVISLTGEQYLYYVSFHCFVLPACLFPCGPASRAR